MAILLYRRRIWVFLTCPPWCRSVVLGVLEFGGSSSSVDLLRRWSFEGCLVDYIFRLPKLLHLVTSMALFHRRPFFPPYASLSSESFCVGSFLGLWAMFPICWVGFPDFLLSLLCSSRRPAHIFFLRFVRSVVFSHFRWRSLLLFFTWSLFAVIPHTFCSA